MKKKFWRCFVCNDIHYGLKPPEICPTCLVKEAYVEISAREARTIMGTAPDVEFDRAEFKRALEAFTVGQEFQLNPDGARVELLLDGVFENVANHGLKYCPCRLRTKNFVEDLILVCPCNFPIHETYKNVAGGECWCSLFKKR